VTTETSMRTERREVGREIAKEAYIIKLSGILG